MVQVLHPVDPLAHKPRSYSFRCAPLSHRPSPCDLAFSQSRRQTAIEQVAIRKFTLQLAARASSLPKLAASQSLPAILVDRPDLALSSAPPLAPGISTPAEPIEPEEIPGTPATPVESREYYPEPESQLEPQPGRKADIFNTTTKSDVLLDLTIAALHRIYIDDYSTDWPVDAPVQAQPAATLQVPSWPNVRPSIDRYDQSPPAFGGSAASSVDSTPSSGLPTPNSFSPAFDPEIASETIELAYTAPIAAAAAKPVKRTYSVPVQSRSQAPTFADKNLRWFLFELLRRSRSSASVVQLALHYLEQARRPVGRILHRRFKSEPRSDQEDSPLLDPRRLMLAAIILSTKLLHDHAPNNRAWSRVCGLTPPEVGACERALCQALDWNLANMFVGPRDDQPVVV